MPLSLREKQSFYEHLAQLLRAGIAFPGAVEKLEQSSRGTPRRLLQELRELLISGKSVTEAFGALRPAVSDMECTALAALERTGRMDRGFQHLADYFGALYEARRETIRGSAYPVIVLHLGVLVSKLPTLIMTSDVGTYLRQTGFIFFCLYGVFAIIALLIPFLRDAGEKSAMADWLLNLIPFTGKIRRSFALARFCATYDMHLEAGVNVMDSLQSAGRASRSGLITNAVEHAVPELRQGSQLGPQLAQFRAFPQSFVQTIMVAENTGELDKALERLTSQYQSDGMRALRAFANWVPRILYFGVAIYVAYSIVTMYAGYLKAVMDF